MNENQRVRERWRQGCSVDVRSLTVLAAFDSRAARSWRNCMPRGRHLRRDHSQHNKNSHHPPRRARSHIHNAVSPRGRHERDGLGHLCDTAGRTQAAGQAGCGSSGGRACALPPRCCQPGSAICVDSTLRRESPPDSPPVTAFVERAGQPAPDDWRRARDAAVSRPLSRRRRGLPPRGGIDRRTLLPGLLSRRIRVRPSGLVSHARVPAPLPQPPAAQSPVRAAQAHRRELLQSARGAGWQRRRPQHARSSHGFIRISGGLPRARA